MKRQNVKQQIIEYLNSNPHESFSQSLEDKRRLAVKLGDASLHLQTIGWLLWRLWKEGLIDSKKEGRKRIFYAKSKLLKRGC